MSTRSDSAVRKIDAPSEGPDLRKADRMLVGVVDSALKTAASKAGHWLVCRPGCTECCIGPFPITRLDVWRLREGLSELAAREPARAAAIAERAIRALVECRDGFPGDARTGRLSGDSEAEDRFFEKHAAAPCPVLDPATGCCELYESRPITCRTYGPPVRFGTQTLPPCHLCFQGASAEEVERCRVEPDPDRIERAIVERLEREEPGAFETIIAYAVAPQSDRED